MDYTITAPVVLQFRSAGFEEEHIRGRVTADSVEEAVESFQDYAYEILVETDNCDAVEFYSYTEFEDRYDIQTE